MARKKAPAHKIIDRLPTEKEFWKLAKATGYAGLISRKCVPTALENSLFGVVAKIRNSVVGTGRVVGDGAVFYYIQDLMVMPEHQRQGIGSAILDGLMRIINETATSPCFISLFTSKGLKKLFTPYGFQGPETYLYGMSIGKGAGEMIGRNVD